MIENNADKALRYIQRSQELLKIAGTIKDTKSQQIIIQSAEDYERIAAELTAGT